MCSSLRSGKCCVTTVAHVKCVATGSSSGDGADMDDEGDDRGEDS